MKPNRSSRALRIGLAFLVGAGVLAVLRPWTVVPIQTTVARTFNPDEYVASVWDSRVLPAAESSALDLRTYFKANPRPAKAVFVKGTATVAAVDRKSRIGLARLEQPAGQDAAAIQIGPVLRGTALRDALEFIRFTDFVNQLEFVGVANALNQRVITGVLGGVDVDGLAGREIAFVGAVAAPAAGSALEIVPVRLQVAGGAK